MQAFCLHFQDSIQYHFIGLTPTLMTQPHFAVVDLGDRI